MKPIFFTGYELNVTYGLSSFPSSWEEECPQGGVVGKERNP
ncbi:hypothetical protein [Bacteroides uniformis]